MKLSRQLTLVTSLVMLLLPWAGYQYLGMMSRAMMDGVAMSQAARVQAVKAYLQSRPQLFFPLLNPAGGERVFFPAADEAPLVDALLDEWVDDFVVDLDPGANKAAFLRVLDTLFFAIELQIQSIESDPLSLHLYTQDQIYELALQPNGDVFALGENQEISGLQAGILGKWRAANNATQIEVAMPSRSTGGIFGLEVSYGAHHEKWGLGEGNRATNWVTDQRPLQEALEIFRVENARMSMLTTDGWVVADSGMVATELGPQSIWERFFMDLLPKQVDDQSEEEPDEAMELEQSWLLDLRLPVLRTEMPVRIGGLMLGTLQLDTGLEQFLDIYSRALQRYLLGSLAFILLVAALLFAYSTWISWRVTHLSRWTRLLVDEYGRVNDQFAPSSAGDEIGELSRAYAELTRRLKKHTDYLQGLAGRLSHEIRTPLTIIGSSLENLQSASDPEAQQTYLERARQGVERLRSLLRRMSEASSLEDGIENTRRQNFDPDNLMAELAQGYRHSFPEIGIEFEAARTGTPARLNGSPDLLAQLVDKLLENAVSFSATGTSINIQSSAADGLWRLEISNTGPLLPFEDGADIFSSMVSLRSPKSDVEPHLGLGLSIAKRIAEFHRGSISARNRPDGSGVIFTLVLPVA